MEMTVAVEPNSEGEEVMFSPIKEEEVKFGFRKDKLGNKRIAVTLKFPVLTVAGVLQSLEKGGKAADLVVEACNQLIYQQAREQVNDNAHISQDNFDFNKVDWEYIANLPPAARRGGGIAKETWESFGENYKNVMLSPEAQASFPDGRTRSEEQIDKHIAILAAKFQPMKFNKSVLGQMKVFMEIWFANTQEADEFAPCYEFLMEKADALISADEKQMLENL